MLMSECEKVTRGDRALPWKSLRNAMELAFWDFLMNGRCCLPWIMQNLGQYARAMKCGEGETKWELTGVWDAEGEVHTARAFVNESRFCSWEEQDWKCELGQGWRDSGGLVLDLDW
jgi:hypothetical protein